MNITKKKTIIALSNFAATMIMLIAFLAALFAFGGLFIGFYVASAGLTVLAVVFGFAAVKIVIAIDNYQYPVK